MHRVSTHDIPPRTAALRVKFVITSLPVGGAETLLVNLVERMDQAAFERHVICLKQPGALGERVASRVPLVANLLKHKWDFAVFGRLKRLFRAADAVITVGAGDKMFWGRLAARAAGVQVICSALHSTGWPDGVGRLNRLLTPITDGFIACANHHARHLAERERFPASRVFMVPNGVDTDRFRPNHTQKKWLREHLQLSAEVPIVGIVAALRPEKNHLQFIEAARQVLRQREDTHFVVVGDGPQRPGLEAATEEMGLASHFHFLGNRNDTERLLAGFDIFCLTSKNEANPVSVLEALSSGVPVVSPDVGSLHETVQPGLTGILTRPLCPTSTADALLQLLGNPMLATTMGLAGRQLVRSQWSLETMVAGYENLVINLFNSKAIAAGRPCFERAAAIDIPNAECEVSSTVALVPEACFNAANSQLGTLGSVLKGV